MSIPNLISEHEFAELRGCSVRTVFRERRSGNGAPYIKLGSKIFYREEAIQQWLLSRETNPADARGYHK